METVVTITDLTRMSGQYVCVAGCLTDNSCIRPVFQRDRVNKPWLFQNGRIAIQPFAVIEFDTGTKISQPPHTEDVVVNPLYRKVGLLAISQREVFLSNVGDGNVADIFGAEIHDDYGFYVLFGEGTRSLGTVSPSRILDVYYALDQNGKWDYRIAFNDKSGKRYRLKVTDLAFRSFMDYQRSQGEEPQSIADRLTVALKSTRIFLRIGLARRWTEKHPDKCYLQITGVYSFPDYLGGRCFADFLPSVTQTESHAEDFPF